MAATIADIARSVGVSPATVSRVLNSPALVKRATRDKVLSAMAEQHYVYNALAGSLTKKQTRTLGLIIPTITNPIFALSTKGIQDAAAARGYSILLGSTDYSAAIEYKLAGLFPEKRVDGIILTGTPLEKSSFDFLKKHGIPFVVTWDFVDCDDISCITFDNTKAARQVVEYLVSLGHRRIAMIAGRFSETGRALKRWQGYTQALKDHGLTYDERLVVQKEYTVSAGKEGVTRLLRNPDPPTAVFCGNDILAYGAIAGVKEQGLRVGPDVSIVGFDDLEMSGVMDPPLTTVRIPGHTMGRLGAETLIDQIEGRQSEVVNYVLETDLILRASAMNPGGSSLADFIGRGKACPASPLNFRHAENPDSSRETKTDSMKKEGEPLP